MVDRYLIWSNEHNAWWGPNMSGYVRRVEHAGRYNHIEAIDICTKALAGASDMLPEIPVRLFDVMLMLRFHRKMYPGHDPEPNERDQ